MKNKFFLIILLFICGQSTTVSLFAQPIPHQLDSLNNMSKKQFNEWLISQLDAIRTNNTDLFSLIVCNRIESYRGELDDTLVQFLKGNMLSKSDKILLIDKLLPCALKYRQLSIDLLFLKSVYLKDNSISDSTVLAIYIKLEPWLEEENDRLVKIQYRNYLDIANFYLNVYQDKSKAEEYFIKVRQYPFNLEKNINNMYFFKNLYVLASMGQIACRIGNYPRLKELQFLPSTYLDILPSYQIAIENSGGICQLCNEYLKNNKLETSNYPPPPPVIDQEQKQ